MLRFLFIFFFFAFSVYQVKSQDFYWSDGQKLKGGAIFSKVVGENDAGVFLLRFRNRFFTKYIVLEQYSPTLSLLKTKTIDLGKYTLLKIKLTPNGVVLITGYQDRERGAYTIYGQWFGFNLEPISQKVTIDSYPNLDLLNKGNILIKIDEENNFLGVLNVSGRGKQTFVSFANYNLDFSLNYKKEIALAYNYAQFIVQDFLITPKGRILTLVKNQNDKVFKSFRTNELRLFDTDGKSVNDYLISDTLNFRNAAIQFDRFQQSVKTFAFFKNKKYRGYAGYLTHFLFLENDSTVFSQSLFSAEMAQDLGQFANQQTIPENFEITALVPRSDGGLLALAEQKNISVEDDIHFINGIPQTSARNIYTFNDVLLLNLDHKGQIEKYGVVHKNQTSINDGGYYSSVILFVAHSFVQVIYNDLSEGSNTVLQNKLFASGNLSGSPLFSGNFDNIGVIPPEATQVSSNKVIIPCQKNRKFALLKIVYP